LAVGTVWLSEMSSPEAAEAAAREARVAILPLGSTEQHGPHLPLDVDTRITAAMCEAAAREVAGEVGVVIAPPLAVGISEHHMRFAGSLTLSPETFTAAAFEIGASLVRQGFDRLVLVNGHAGNAGAMQIVASRLRLEAGATLVVSVHEWSLAREAFAAVRDSGPGGAAHACEYETSLYLHLRPEAVALERAIAEPAVAAVEGGLVDLFLGGPYGVALGPDFSRSGVLGDPTLATAEKGRMCFEAAVAELARLLREAARHRP
jgi:creatinine amidohydrolase